MRIRLAVVAAWLPFVAGAPPVARAQPVHAPARAPAEDTTWVSHGAIYEVFVHDFSPAGNFRGVTAGLDCVPDHTSGDSVWVREHPGFYLRNERGELTVPRDPQGKPTDWTDVAQLDYGNPELRRAMIEAMRYWLVEFGIDGFRVDAAGFVPAAFWKEAVPALRAAVPRRILLLAEWGDLEMHRLGVHLTYPWDSYSRLKEVWGGAPASTFIRREVEDLKAMPLGGMRLRFTTNHDETAWDNPPVKRFQGAAGARAAFVAMAFLPGRPLIYNGQEVESPQKLGLFERQPVVWSQPHAEQARAFYRRVLHLARTDPAFLAGDLREVETSAPDDVIAYRRGPVVVLVNARPRAVRTAVTGDGVAGARDLLSGRAQQGDTVALPAYGAVVLRRRTLHRRARAGGGAVYRRTRARTMLFRGPPAPRTGTYPAPRPSGPPCSAAPFGPPSRLRAVYFPGGRARPSEPTETPETAAAPRFATTSTARLPATRTYATTCGLLAEAGISLPVASASLALRT